ncbi:hypothetical protein K3495_g11111 [Podosphaera aphanis]|nr:hypothetical protein K3495_g11111 [Podosphaera aphanis]
MSNRIQSPSEEMPPPVDTNYVPVSVQQPSTDKSEIASFRDILAVGLHRGIILNNVVRLEGPETFDAWESDMLAVWNSAGLYEIVVEGQQPIEGAVPTERRAHRVLSGFAVGVYVQVVHTDIRQRMLEKQDSHLVWLYLRSEYKKEKWTVRKDSRIAEVANMTTHSVEKVSCPNFIFDTGASTHMCPFPERFRELCPFTGVVNTSSGEAIPVTGKGTVALRCKLSNGCISTFHLKNVLYVPSLTHSLLSWKNVRFEGYTLHDDGSSIQVKRGDELCLEAVFTGFIPIVVEDNNSYLSLLRPPSVPTVLTVKHQA